MDFRLQVDPFDRKEYFPQRPCGHYIKRELLLQPAALPDYFKVNFERFMRCKMRVQRDKTEWVIEISERVQEIRVAFFY